MTKDTTAAAFAPLYTGALRLVDLLDLGLGLLPGLLVLPGPLDLALGIGELFLYPTVSSFKFRIYGDLRDDKKNTLTM